MLVYDGSMHAGQLQFRPYVPNTVSPNGLHDPLYWMDFKGHAPDLPSQTLALFCYHVGQRDDTSERDPRYFGRGIGLRLLEETLRWATSAGFEAVVAKGCPRFRPVIEYMGGMPTEVYKTKDFEVVASYHDPDLRAAFDDMLLSNDLEGVDLDDAAEVSVCVHRPSLSQ
jgi:GNAT superfamily N-acetyltransferase